MSTSSAYRDGTWILSEDGKVRASFTDLGEGYSGDYDAHDPEDAALYRLDIEIASHLVDEVSGLGFDETDDPKWVQPYDGSICTSVEIENVTGAVIMDLLTYAANTVAEAISHSDSIKGTMDALSYLPAKRTQADLYN